MPGFGGMFFDDNGDFNIYLMEDVQALSAEAIEVIGLPEPRWLSRVFWGRIFSLRDEPNVPIRAKRPCRRNCLV